MNYDQWEATRARRLVALTNERTRLVAEQIALEKRLMARETEVEALDALILSIEEEDYLEAVADFRFDCRRDRRKEIL